MKRILYLDKAFLDSFIAQSEAGLPGQRTYTNANNMIDGQSVAHPSVNHRVSGNAHATVGLASGDLHYEHELLSETQKDLSLVSDAASEAVTLIPHDNALEDVIRESGARDRDGMEVGAFVIASGGRPFVYDIRDILSSLDDEAIRFIAEKTAEEKIARLPNPAARQVDGERKRIISEQTSQLKTAKKSLEAACKFAQFDVCIIIRNVIAPLKREWMRTTSRDMIFKYSSRLFLFGQVTRSQEETEKARDLNPIEQLNALFNGTWPQALQRMQIIPMSNYWIVDPMALYFE